MGSPWGGSPGPKRRASALGSVFRSFPRVDKSVTGSLGDQHTPSCRPRHAPSALILNPGALGRKRPRSALAPPSTPPTQALPIAGPRCARPGGRRGAGEKGQGVRKGPRRGRTCPRRARPGRAHSPRGSCRRQSRGGGRPWPRGVRRPRGGETPFHNPSGESRTPSPAQLRAPGDRGAAGAGRGPLGPGARPWNPEGGHGKEGLSADGCDLRNITR